MAGLVGYAMGLVARIPLWSNAAYVQGLSVALFAPACAALGLRFWIRARAPRAHGTAISRNAGVWASLFASSILVTQAYFFLRALGASSSSGPTASTAGAPFLMFGLFAMTLLVTAACALLEAVDLSADRPGGRVRRWLDGLSVLYIAVGLLVALALLKDGLTMMGA